MIIFTEKNYLDATPFDIICFRTKTFNLFSTSSSSSGNSGIVAVVVGIVE